MAMASGTNPEDAAATLGGWNISHQLYEWTVANLPPGRTILELGSGAGTALLARRWTVYSVEHDSRFVGRYDSTYIEAPIVNGWYDADILRTALPSGYDLLLVDGPPAHIGRRGLIDHLESDFRIESPS